MAFNQNDRNDNEKNKFMEDADGNVAVRTNAIITGDVNIDSTSLSTDGYVGKANADNADFSTSYASVTALSCTDFPSDISALKTADVVSVQQINSSGEVVNTYTRDDMTITILGTDPTTVVIDEASFSATDDFIVHTNIARPSSGADVDDTNFSTANDSGQVIMGVYSASPDTIDDGDKGAILISSDRKTITNTEGTVAHDSADSGKPVSIGGIAKSAQQTAVAAADRVKAVFNLYGELVLAGYNWASNTLGVTESDPLSSHHVEETLADVTDETAATNYYYIDMDGFQKLSLQIEIPGLGTATVTASVEATNQDDGTAPASCTYQDITQYGMDVETQSSTAANYTADVILTLPSQANYKYIRVKTISGGADDGDYTIYSKKWY